MAEGMFIPDMVEEDDGGIAADHAPRLTLPVLAAPFTDAQKTNFNTFRRSLVCVACKDVPGSHYAFDSSVLAPESSKGFAALKGILDRHPGSPLSIFGHADPEGTEIYNKFLSERRAEVVFGMLVRDVPTWERLFSDHKDTPGDVWGDPAVERMLGALGFKADVANDEKLGDVIKRYQTDRGIAPSGKNDKALRAKLFAEYMDFLCSDDKGVPFSLTKADFLGEGAKHGAFQGCSEFNPQLVLAKSEEDAFKADKANGKDARAEANFDNRRAIIYLFKAGSKINPAKWPCPRASDPDKISKCIAHFWSDGNDRKGKLIDDKRRRFGKAVRNHTERLARIEHTFACRFYHGLAQHSPCERDLQMWVLQLLVDAPREPGKETGLEQKPLANVRYVLTASQEVTAPILRGTTSANGVIGIPLWVPIAQMTLKLDMLSAMLGSLPPAPDKRADDNEAPVGVDLEVSVDSDQFKDEDTFVGFSLFGGNLKRIVTKVGNPKSDPLPEPDALEPDAGEPPVAQDEQTLGARQRLYNLGFGVAEPEKWTDAQETQFITRFQKDRKFNPVTGKLDQQTVDALRDDYGS
ncbi:MAG: hypothetical protein M3Y05_03125 [Gemmatimonadota bacterium]|nr:hypothetical protein [Gemmatimonadota bacterium]